MWIGSHHIMSHSAVPRGPWGRRMANLTPRRLDGARCAGDKRRILFKIGYRRERQSHCLTVGSRCSKGDRSLFILPRNRAAKFRIYHNVGET